TTSGETGGKSILDGNKTQTILEFNPVNNIAINNIHFQNSYNEDPFDNGDSFDNGGGAVHIGKRKILFSGTNFSNSTATPRGGAILDLGGRGDRANILRFNGKATFSSNESTSGDGGAVLDLTSGK
ncbi:MAG: hypothetical protein LBP39_01835, partial [Rickettsiales bacterium]|nr:hypothetical protein [Rickettsiales bacterium]